MLVSTDGQGGGYSNAGVASALILFGYGVELVECMGSYAPAADASHGGLACETGRETENTCTAGSGSIASARSPALETVK